jgi:6-phosphogluconolactonase
VIFPIDGAGKLGTPTFQPSGGQVPRNFTVDPEEKFVIVANQTSKNVVVFRMNKDTGALTKLTTLTLDQTVPFVTLVRYPN